MHGLYVRLPHPRCARFHGSVLGSFQLTTVHAVCWMVCRYHLLSVPFPWTQLQEAVVHAPPVQVTRNCRATEPLHSEPTSASSKYSCSPSRFLQCWHLLTKSGCQVTVGHTSMEVGLLGYTLSVISSLAPLSCCIKALFCACRSTTLARALCKLPRSS